MCTVAAASGAASVRVRHIMSRGWDPWTERPLPEGVRVAYPPIRSRECPRRTSGLHQGAARLCLQLLMKDRKSTRLNSSHVAISYAVFCLKKKKEAGKGRGALLSTDSRSRAP